MKIGKKITTICHFCQRISITLEFVNMANYMKLKEISKLDINIQLFNCAIFMPVIPLSRKRDLIEDCGY